jgi:hypothetical protein
LVADDVTILVRVGLRHFERVIGGHLCAELFRERDAALTALRDTAEPSVGIRMRLNMLSY